jgi:transposase
VDTKGRPLNIELTPGQQHDSTMTEALLLFAQGGACIADMGYDADRILVAIQALGMKAVIPPNPTRTVLRLYDKELYRLRYRVECFFHDLKRFRRVATRYEKTARNYLAFVLLASATTWLTLS